MKITEEEKKTFIVEQRLNENFLQSNQIFSALIRCDWRIGWTGRFIICCWHDQMKSIENLSRKICFLLRKIMVEINDAIW